MSHRITSLIAAGIIAVTIVCLIFFGVTLGENAAYR